MLQRRINVHEIFVFVILMFAFHVGVVITEHVRGRSHVRVMVGSGKKVNVCIVVAANVGATVWHGIVTETAGAAWAVR